MNVQGYDLTATVYGLAGHGEILEQITTALAAAGIVVEYASVRGRVA